MEFVPHGQQSFHVRSFIDMIEKLNFEIDEYDKTRLTDGTNEARAYRGLNCAWTAWHVHDWFWQWIVDDRSELVSRINAALTSNLPEPPSKYPTKFGEAIAQKYRPLAVCRTVATAAKHSRADRYPDLLVTRGVYVTRGESFSTSEQWFDLRVFDNSENRVKYFDQLIKEAAGSWTTFFRDIGIWTIKNGWVLDR